MLKTLAIVVPCYNEEAVIEESYRRLTGLLDELIEQKKISLQSRIYFVDDGSQDKTWSMLETLHNKNPQVVALKLSRNKGHQNALYAGLCSTTEDMVVSIDADLQDDPDNITAMVDAFLEGADVVYGVRNERKTDTFFKRFTAESYYRVMQGMGVNLVFNHADFRLLSRRVINALKEYPESNLFLRGLVQEIGYQSSTVEYERKERFAGESKYPLKKMLSFAWNGITSFSTAPLRAITVLGLCSGFISTVIILWVLGVRIFTDNAIPGWTSILLPLLFIGSVQLISLGIIGEYLAKLYNEVKARPKYHLSECLHRNIDDKTTKENTE